MKIALVHDYLYTYGGAERVLEAFHEIWPTAPVYTAWVDWQWLKKEKPEWLNWQIIPSWFDKIPFKKQLCSPLRFLTPKIWSSFNLANFDVVISSSAWYMSKGVSLSKIKDQRSKIKDAEQNLKIRNSKTINNQLSTINNSPLHICYCHTPPRYLYGYETDFDWQRFWLTRMYAYFVNPFMRYYDFKSSQTVDWFICNSLEVQRRIKKFYRREAEVIYPPVSINSKLQAPNYKQYQNPKPQTPNYFLMVNRLVRHKNIDLAIITCKQLKINLKIVGIGPDKNRLEKIADNDPNIEFLGYVDDKKLANLYQNCQVVLYLASQEDFGITPVEAMSFGKPVIALRSGGVKESIIEGKTGLFIKKPEVEELVKSLQAYKLTSLQAKDCLKQAEKFTKERFKKQIKEFINYHLKNE